MISEQYFRIIYVISFTSCVLATQKLDYHWDLFRRSVFMRNTPMKFKPNPLHVCPLRVCVEINSSLSPSVIVYLIYAHYMKILYTWLKCCIVPHSFYRCKNYIHPLFPIEKKMIRIESQCEANLRTGRMNTYNQKWIMGKTIRRDQNDKKKE